MSTVVQVYICLLSILNNLFCRKKTQWIILNLCTVDYFQTIIIVFNPEHCCRLISIPLKMLDIFQTFFVDEIKKGTYS